MNEHCTRREFAAAAAAVATLAGTSRPAAAQAARRPHILWLITDEHRLDSLACAGLRPWVQSPHLDRLAAAGTLFRQAYCQAPACVASRVSMLTGRYPHHTSVFAFEYNHAETEFGVPYFTSLLHAAGYTVASFGKEHHHRVASVAEQHTRDGRWWNLHRAFPDKNEGHNTYFREATPDTLRVSADQEDALGVVRRRLTAKPLILAGRNPVAAGETSSAWLSDLALGYLADEAPRDRPLFLRVSYNYPHTPHLPPAPFDTLFDPRSIPLPPVSDDELAGFGPQHQTAYTNLRTHGMSEDEIRRMRAHYFGLCAHADEQLGRVIDGFRAWCGDEPWLILFCADHGCKLGEHGMHEKFTFYDESVRVPLIAASSDDRLPRGRVVDSFAELVDLAPTFLTAAGVSRPDYLDGVDLSDLAHGRIEARTETISEKRTYGRRAMLRTARWSFEMQVDAQARTDRLPPADELRAKARELPLAELDVTLFDREGPDFGENRNLAGDPAHAAVCEELRHRLIDRIMPPTRAEYPWWRDLKAPAR